MADFHCVHCGKIVPPHEEIITLERGLEEIERMEVKVVVYTCHDCNFSVSGDGWEEAIEEAIRAKK